jgi:hypothetical protein
VEDRYWILYFMREISLLLIDDIAQVSVEHTNLLDRDSDNFLSTSERMGRKTKNKYLMDNFILHLSLVDGTVLNVSYVTEVKEKLKSKKGVTRLVDALTNNTLSLTYRFELPKPEESLPNEDSTYVEDLMQQMQKQSEIDRGLINNISFKKYKNEVKLVYTFLFTPSSNMDIFPKLMDVTYNISNQFLMQYRPMK